MISTLEELDAELTRIDATDSYDEHKRIFAGFRMEVARPKMDPASDEHRANEMRIYEWISGRTYAPANEATPIDVVKASRIPHPYLTRSASAVGDQLMVIGFLIKTLDLPPGSRVLELGAGWGNLTVAMARMGYSVTAVDISSDFLEVIATRARMEGCTIDLVHGDFAAAAELEGSFDAIVFFASFHHCADHRALLTDLDRMLRPGGKVAFAAEPITDDFEVPWGIRLDGESLWAIRRQGWLECGFQESYFRDLLGRMGWSVRKTACADPAWGEVFVAQRREP